MSYTKQNFQNGQVLTAEHMKKLENGILKSEFCNQENTIKILTIQAGDIEGSISYELTEGAGPYAAIIATSNLASVMFENGHVSSSIGSYNYDVGLATTVKGQFTAAETLPWRESLKVSRFEYAKGTITISLKNVSDVDISYICILAKEGSAESFLGDMIIDTLNPLINKVNDLENRLAQIEATL